MFEGRIREVERPDRILSYFGQEKAVLLVVTVTGILYNLGMGRGPISKACWPSASTTFSRAKPLPGTWSVWQLCMWG